MVEAAASREEEAARRELDSAERLLRSCLRPRGGPAAAHRRGVVQPLVERLQAAYTDIWQLKLLQGLDKLKVGIPPRLPQAAVHVEPAQRPPAVAGQQQCGDRVL